MRSSAKPAVRPVSANQSRMYVLNRLSPEGTAYNVPLALRLEGPLDVRQLRRALAALVARHASLRTAFTVAGDAVVQKIKPHVRVALPVLVAGDNADVERIKSAFVRPFDLHRAPLLRACLIRLEHAEHVLLIDLHHIICDGVSVDVLSRDLGRLYGGQRLDPPSADYAEFAESQRQFACTAQAKAQEAYWLALLADPPELRLPTDATRTAAHSYAGARIFTRPSAELVTALRGLAARGRASMYMVLLAAYCILLARYAGHDDVVLGTLVAGRQEERFRDVVGLFVNTLVLRSWPKGELAFIEYLKEVRGSCLSAFENQDFQFEELVNRIAPARNLARNPLFDTMFCALTQQPGIGRYGAIEFSRYELDYHIAKFDLSLTVIEEQDGGLMLELEYRADLFRRDTIQRMSAHYLNILARVTADPRVKLSEIDMLTADEYRLTAPAHWQTGETNVLDLFLTQVRAAPGDCAVSSSAGDLSYGELHRRSTAWAARLQRNGIGPGSLVAVAASPSADMLVALFAILKCRAAFLPIDPATPAERFERIRADSGVALLLSDGQADWPACPGVLVIRLGEEIEHSSHDPLPPAQIRPEDPAYVLYTSGSTGTPKGVMISHAALANYVTCATATYEAGRDTPFALHSPLWVDLTITSLFVPLTSGGCCVVYRCTDALGLTRAIVRDDRVELLKVTPSHLALLLEVLRDCDRVPKRLRKIIVGGEDFKSSLAAEIDAGFHGRVEQFNEYGPTEATVGCTIHRYEPVDRSLSVPIGRAIDNTSVFVLDGHGNRVPVGVTGELYIAGLCLANGYLNDPERTAQRFVTRRIGDDVIRMYRTGDLARLAADGTLHYLGRNDDQVKIRGYRIELGEVEAHVRRLAGVTATVVTTWHDGAGDARLCAYVVTDNHASATDLRAQLAQQLPAHMLPTWFVSLLALPLARGGKVDKKALPDPRELTLSGRPYAPPRSPIELAMARIWEQVLGLERVGVDDNFFELGGQSLKATIMVAMIERELRAKLELRDVFAHPVIRELGELLAPSGQGLSADIKPVGAQPHYPVSSAQKRLWILNQMAPDDVQYNVPWAIAVKGPFDRARWHRAFAALVARHEALRTSFALNEGEIVQIVHPRVNFAFEPLSADRLSTVAQTMARFVRPFDLASAPLIRAAFLADAPDAHTIVVDSHHIVSDGISLEIILEDLVAAYRGESIEAASVQYKEYAVWQRVNAGSAAICAQREHWKQVFAGEPPVLDLPADFARHAVQSFAGDLVKFRLDAPVIERLRAINRRCGTTMHMLLLAAYTVLLAKYAGQDDIVVGTPVAGRNHAALQRIVGMFVNTLALRNQPRDELPFAEFLARVRDRALEAYANQDYQFDELVEQLAVERNLSRNPLFDTVFAMVAHDRRSFEVDGARIEPLDFDLMISKFDLTLLAAERDGGIDFELEYCTQLFRRSTMERLAAHYRHILEQISVDPSCRIAELDLLTAAERRQLLVEFNDTSRPYPAEQTIHGLIEAQARRTPDHPAIVFKGAALTYREMDCRANQMARRLAARGAAAGQTVAIIAGPCTGMIVGVLGILKAGCAYLPIDRDCPPDRAGAMMSDSCTCVVVTAGGAEWRDTSRPVIDLEAPDVYQGDDSALDARVGPHDPAYLIYTSGSSGTPKGVLIEHHSVNNLCTWHNETFAVTAADRATKFARFGFDASVWEIFPYLQAGAELHVIDEDVRIDLPRLNRYFENNAITVSFLPTQIYELFGELKNTSLRILLTGGDRLRLFRPTRYRVVNNYGPTESSVVATSAMVTEASEHIPIGRPIFNTRAYVLGRADALVPIGVPGELCISGAGLARGYVGDAARTAEKFVANPFEPGSLMYRTGDVVRWLPDGSLEFIGRTDNQIKVRGCRIEPREIEAAILAHDAVKDAVVVARDDRDGNKHLCACVVWQADEEPAELRAYLAKRLPHYMVPAQLFAVESIPLNARGKIDLAGLPALDSSSAAARGTVMPRTDAERRLANIWCGVLEREHVGIDHNFFEIGGDSLRATIMLARANKEFATDLALRVVFDHPTVASLARCFENVAAHDRAVLKPAPPSLHYPTTPTQALLHAVCSSRKGVEYNLPFAFRLRGELDSARLQTAFRRLTERHEAFRTSFRMVAGRLRLQVAPRVELALERLPECDEHDLEEVVRDFIRPFDPATAPLIRAALVPLRGGDHVLMIDVHHLVSDGTSMGLMYKEIAELYAGAQPALPAATFKDFAAWLDGHLKSDKVRAQEKYWLELFADAPPLLRLDTDYPRPEAFSFAGGRLRFEVDQQTHVALKALCARHGVTLYMLLLAAYDVLLSKYSGAEDVIVGVPTSGRYLADVQDVIGMFVSTHATRSRPRRELRFDEFLEHVKADVLGTLEHQEYPLWNLMVSHMIRRGGKPLFTTIFVVQDQTFVAMQVPGVSVEEMDAGYHVSKFDLTLGALERASGIAFELEYSTELFRRSTMRSLADRYLHLLAQIVADPAMRLGDIALATDAERRQVLETFNPPSRAADDDRTVLHLFEHWAQVAPTRVAALCGGTQATFGEVDRRANRLARHLVRSGVQSGDRVAIMARPSFEMIVAILAVWKASAAYVPVGCDWPEQRLAFVLADSGAPLLLGDARSRRPRCAVPFVDIAGAAALEADDSSLDRWPDGAALALVEYAADRDGVLKGIMIEQRSLRERCRWYVERFAVAPDDRGVKYGDVAGRSSSLELWPFLGAGAAVLILPDETARDGRLLDDFLRRNGPTHAWLPAPHCERLARLENETLRFVLTCGGHVGAVRRGKYELVRCAGPAETTVLATSLPVRGTGAGDNIGKPAGLSHIRILGHDDGMLPVGVSGELCVAGAGVAAGYWDDAETTSRQFEPCPHGAPGRMFRTGQSARWLADGTIALTGPVMEASIDGHRVSLAEIECLLRSNGAIDDAVVVFDDRDPLSERLVAFIVVRGTGPVPAQSFVQAVWHHLAQWLPPAMIPDTYMQVGAIPRDLDGRVQREQLPLPELAPEPAAASPPSVAKVAEIVGDVLGVDTISPDEDLSALGMTSLAAARLATRIHSSFGAAPDLCRIRSAPTISAISNAIEASGSPS
ncbi:amino acid adenylation domain-containing protein [Bradyrhizobium japonicum]